MAAEGRDRDSDTIAAIATAAGVGAIGIIRVSGPDAMSVAQKIFAGERKLSEMKGFEAAHGWIVDRGEKLDEAIVLVMRAPKSYTREDMVEISCHGGPIVLRRVLDAVVAAGARLAGPGEFTRRAFLSGRIDLSQAEAIAALIFAETDAASRAALRGLSGELSDRIRSLRASLIESLALLEAGLDFSEEDIEFISREKLASRLQAAMQDLEELARRARSGKILSQGIRLVIAGRPNVGKSTLMNALLEQDRVIVAPLPGTTRDVVEETVNMDGVPVRISDTAGMGENANEIEKQGVERTKRAIAQADLILLLLDNSEPLTDYDRMIIAETSGRPRLVLVNKIDLATGLDRSELERIMADDFLEISAKTGQGIPDLRERIGREIWKGRVPSEDALVSTLRQLNLLEQCRAATSQAINASKQGLGEEFIASDLRKAIDLLGQISGESVSEEVLRIIFSQFCVGK